MSPHVQQYLMRLDRKLAGLDDDQRKGYLRNQLGNWLYRYERFADKVDRGIETDEEVTTWDYLDTILEITARI